MLAWDFKGLTELLEKSRGIFLVLVACPISDALITRINPSRWRATLWKCCSVSLALAVAVAVAAAAVVVVAVAVVAVAVAVKKKKKTKKCIHLLQ